MFRSTGRSRRSRNRVVDIGFRAVVVVSMLAGATIATTGTAAAAPTPTFTTFSNSNPVGIPDAYVDPDNVAISDVFPTGLTGDITAVRVSVYISHPNISQVAVTLGAMTDTPSPMFAYLADMESQGGANFGSGCADGNRTTFDDTAGTSIDAGSAPFVGSYSTTVADAGPLTQLIGLTAAAVNDTDWPLYVNDNVIGQAGTLQCWSLFIDTSTDQHLRFDNNTVMPIPDLYYKTATSGIGVHGLIGTVGRVQVSVWITHPNDSDLDLQLISPSGQHVTLAHGKGGTGHNFGLSCSGDQQTHFADSATQQLTFTVAPFLGYFKSQQPLSQFNGQSGSNLNGTWQLQVLDNVATHGGGVLRCWSLSIATNGLAVQAGISRTPLQGTYDVPFFDVTNTTSSTMHNVQLSSKLPNSMTDIRADSTTYPNCWVSLRMLHCSWASIPAHATVRGGAIGRIGFSTTPNVCLDGTASSFGILPATSLRCFAKTHYASPDAGTGYSVGLKAHNLVLRDQNNNLVSLSQYAGDYVLLQFSAVWCPPSGIEVPNDSAAVKNLNNTNAMGVPVIYLLVEINGPTQGVLSTLGDVQTIASTFSLTNPVLYTAGAPTQIATSEHATYSISTGVANSVFPLSVFIRPNGTIFDERLGAATTPSDTKNRFLADLP